MHSPAPARTRRTQTHVSSHERMVLDQRVLASVWEQQRPRVDDRIHTIERATRALTHKQLDSELRARAERCAHMLAGSLGMFGFQNAATAASELERGLSQPTPASAAKLRALLVTVRRDINASCSYAK